MGANPRENTHQPRTGWNKYSWKISFIDFDAMFLEEPFQLLYKRFCILNKPLWFMIVFRQTALSGEMFNFNTGCKIQSGPSVYGFLPGFLMLNNPE